MDFELRTLTPWQCFISPIWAARQVALLIKEHQEEKELLTMEKEQLRLENEMLRRRLAWVTGQSLS